MRLNPALGATAYCLPEMRRFLYAARLFLSDHFLLIPEAPIYADRQQNPSGLASDQMTKPTDLMTLKLSRKHVRFIGRGQII